VLSRAGADALATEAVSPEVVVALAVCQGRSLPSSSAPRTVVGLPGRASRPRGSAPQVRHGVWSAGILEGA